jgi:hypothetical protein
VDGLEAAISDEPKLYSDEEIALILREATQSAESLAPTPAAASGLSLAQIKAAAAEAGLDPVLVERAAHRLSHRGSESFFERLAGGPLKHRETIQLPIALSEEVSTRLLSAIRAAAEVPGKGSADASGFAWHAWYKGSPLSVTAHEDSKGTRIQLLVDRTGSMVRRLFYTQFAVLMSVWMFIEELDTLPEFLTSIVLIPIGIVAAARAFWKSSTRATQERVAVLANAVRDSLPHVIAKNREPETPGSQSPDE